MRRIGVLMPLAADDPEGKARVAAFMQKLQQLGWSDGGNVRIDTRWGGGDAHRYRGYAATAEPPLMAPTGHLFPR
jgi:putative ABC transport system substrate-binding protein